MSFLKVIPSKIDVPNTMLDLLKGTNDLWLQNGCFEVVKDKYTAELFKQNIVKGKNDGISLRSPRLFIRSPNNGFVSQYRIEFTSKLMNRETYRFAKPSEKNYPNGIAKRKNFLRTRIVDREAEMQAMIRIDNIVYVTTEFLLLATVLGYDFRTCNSDRELVEGLLKVLSPNHYQELLARISEDYWKNIANPPLWTMDETVAGNYRIVNDDPSSGFVSLFNMIFDTKTGKGKPQPGSVQEDIYKSLFHGKIKGNAVYDFLMNTPSNDIMPMCKRVVYYIEGEDGDEGKTTEEIRLLFFVEEKSGQDYSPNFPQSLYTKVVKRGGVYDSLTGKDYMTMIGYRDNPSNDMSTYYKGFIWLRNSIDLIKYGPHQTHSNWIVTETILTKTEGGRTKFKVDDEYFVDEPDAVADTAPKQAAVTDSGEISGFKSAEDLANEFEDDA